MSFTKKSLLTIICFNKDLYCSHSKVVSQWNIKIKSMLILVSKT